MNKKTCAIFGYRLVSLSDWLYLKFAATIKHLILSGYSTFLFGELGEFEKIGYEIICMLKKEFPYIKCVYVCSASKKSGDENAYIYDDLLFVSASEDIWQKRIQKRKQMVDCSTSVIVCKRGIGENHVNQTSLYAKDSKKDIFLI